MKCLSVVVPMYNVESYIGECLDSFLIDGIGSDVEVLVIDDGSTDGSSSIAGRYEQEHGDIFRVIRKKNGGHGSAVNCGIEEASGNYLKVVDGDDWVDREAFLLLVENLKRTDADLVFSNYNWVDFKTRQKKKETEVLCPNIEYDKDYPAYELLELTFLKMHAMTFRRELLKNMPERLDEHCFYVDTEYMVFPLPYVRTIRFLEACVYQYRVGMLSQSMNIENMKKRCYQHEHVLNRLLDYYRKFSGDDSAAAMALVIGRVVVSQYKIYLSFSEDLKGKLVHMDRMLQKDYPEIYVKCNHKAVKLLRVSNYHLYPAISWAVRFKLK